MIKLKFLNHLAFKGNLFLFLYSLKVSIWRLITTIIGHDRILVIFLLWGIHIFWEGIKIYITIGNDLLAGQILVLAVLTLYHTILICRIFGWAFRIFVIILVFFLHYICKKFKMGVVFDLLLLIHIFDQFLTLKLMSFLRDKHFDIFSLNFTGVICLGCRHFSW